MKKITLSIEGMTCSACSNGLEKYLNKQKGIEKASVNLVMANATIEYDEKIVSAEKLDEFVKEAGFKSLGEFKEIKEEKQSKKDKILFIIYTILAILLMYISMGHMLKLPSLPLLDMHKNPVNYMVSMLILTILFIIYGFDIIRNGYKNLINRVPNMDTLVSVGVLTSFCYSIYNMIQVLNGNMGLLQNLYFESAAIVIYFIKLGRYIDKISKNKTKSAIQKLVKITPSTACLKIDGKEKTVTLDEIKKGDILIARPGEKIAVDGIIVSGKSHLDESFITGESKPVEKKEKDTVLAGSINYDGYIEYRAEKIGKESAVSEIVKLVIEASNSKMPIAKIADKVSGIFVPVVIAIAIITFLVYLLLGSEFSTAIISFVTVLVVACPCSLGLATPLAIVISEGLCASNGILIKKSEVLESAVKVDTVVFDKTGTLTYGKLKISKIINYTDQDDKELLKMVGTLEEKSTHPIGKAFTDYLEENNIKTLKVENIENISGYGIVGTISEDKIIVGNSKILEKYNIENTHLEDEKNLSKEGNSIVYLAKNKEILAIIGVNDIVRENAKKVIQNLKENKIETIMLTGDNKEVAEKIANEIGITKVISNVLPKEKENIIKELKEKNKFVMMLGDGINDSPALARADIGVSIKSATDIAMDSSDVILTNNDLNAIINLIGISKKTIRNIKQNLFWAFFYNCLMIPVATGILKPVGISINPMLASLAMVLSSITVILNALRLKKIKN